MGGKRAALSDCVVRTGLYVSAAVLLTVSSIDSLVLHSTLDEPNHGTHGQRRTTSLTSMHTLVGCHPIFNQSWSLEHLHFIQ